MRKIIHIDMDCFFAAVEMRDNPALRDVPMAVGGRPDTRGVIATSNYPARKFGVRSAMASAYALRLCPHLILVPTDIKKYYEASQIIHAIFAEFSDIIEPLSLDEAFIDVTSSEHFQGSATLIAHEIRRRIFAETSLTASAGVAPNKFLAKVASDVQKPDGLTVITPDKIPEFVRTLPVARIPGVGPVTQERMKTLGILTCQDLQRRTPEELMRHFGNSAQRLFELSHGIDERPVRTERTAKSVSTENTYPEDLPTLGHCIQALPPLLTSLKRRLARKETARQDNTPSVRGIFVKLKFDDFEQTTLERTGLKDLTLNNFAELLEAAHQRGNRPVRLIGIGVRLDASPHDGPEQLELPLGLP